MTISRFGRRVTSRSRGRPRFGLASFAAAETVVLKNGVVYRGAVDRDNTIVSIFDPDGLKQVVLRDSKIARTSGDEGSASVEVFSIDQPLTKHAGEMPTIAYGVKATPWDKFGRRQFRYIGPRGGKPIEMTQAIFKLGPRSCKVRGVDGFWVSQISTSTVPRDRARHPRQGRSEERGQAGPGLQVPHPGRLVRRGPRRGPAARQGLRLHPRHRRAGQERPERDPRIRGPQPRGRDRRPAQGPQPRAWRPAQVVPGRGRPARRPRLGPRADPQGPLRPPPRRR